MLNIPTIYGKSIVLREIKESDIDDRYAFGRPKEFAYMCGGNRDETVEFPPREEWENWYQHNLILSDDKISWMIEYDCKCIGSAGLHHISSSDHNATFAIGIWVTSFFSKGIGTETTKLVLQHAFDVMKLHRIDLKVLEYNKRGIRCYQKCGFKQDGILRESAYIEGEYHSDIIMSILEDEYRALTNL
jgi:Acetyltransferases, including N-acetylases of ribosomal proteins